MIITIVLYGTAMTVEHMESQSPKVAPELDGIEDGDDIRDGGGDVAQALSLCRYHDVRVVLHEAGQ